MSEEKKPKRGRSPSMYPNWFEEQRQLMADIRSGKPLKPIHTYKHYDTAMIHLKERWYTRKELEEIMQYFLDQDKLLEKSMQESPL